MGDAEVNTSGTFIPSSLPQRDRCVPVPTGHATQEQNTVEFYDIIPQTSTIGVKNKALVSGNRNAPL
ncbi:hypothetical protein C7212DRAFT_332727, partial [Tuber magnatum]